MGNELINVSQLGDLTPAKYDDEAFSKTASSGGDFVPRLQLLTSNSAKCKAGEFPTNHYAMIDGQDFKDVGKNVDILVVDWRPKALETGEDVVAVHDPSDPEFARIQERSLNESDSGCMFGPEFLVYIPSQERFATLFMGTKSSRREAGHVKAKMHQAATLSSQKIETKKYTWFAIKTLPCSTPFDPPSSEDLVEQIERFRNPPKPTSETVEESGRDR